MKRTEKNAMAEFYNENGELFGRTLAAAWTAPNKVTLADGALTIQSVNPYRTGTNSGPLIRAPHGLLDSFVALGAASDESNTLGSGLKKPGPSDQKICRFATRYGGLHVFYQVTRKTKWPQTEHIEYCEVWRYFARVVPALQRIAFALYQGGSGSKEDWYVIHRVPSVMRETAHDSSPGLLHPFAVGDEENWLALAHFVAKDWQQNRVMFGHLINTLLGLGHVRPWLTWPDVSRRVVRPQITYSSRSLLSQLALQLCLRLAKVDTFLVCIHCQRQYTPVKRAPKSGLRNFCPECREAGVSKRYALKDFRLRHRQESLKGEGC
jgi:hypothetical protein